MAALRLPPWRTELAVGVLQLSWAQEGQGLLVKCKETVNTVKNESLQIERKSGCCQVRLRNKRGPEGTFLPPSEPSVFPADVQRKARTWHPKTSNTGSSFSFPQTWAPVSLPQ